MELGFETLDFETRRLMVEEVQADVTGGRIFLSNYLNQEGQQVWPTLLIAAINTGTADTLAEDLRRGAFFRARYAKRTPSGGITYAAVPITAHQTLAEGQFNAYYMRALARRALDSGERLQVYRAKAVANSRSSSQGLIGTWLDPLEVLRVLREPAESIQPSTSRFQTLG
jgi:hypothetical protein